LVVQKLALRWLLAIGLIAPLDATADIVADWGTVVTPLTTEASFAFEQYDITKNFTDQYAFSLEGDAGATYAVTFFFDACRNGCGSPDLSYGIYDANGGLITADAGSVILSAGSYVFAVKGNGMGSGNSLDYSGEVTFTATMLGADSIVAPVPEPASVILTAVGLGIVGGAVWRRRTASTRISRLVKTSRSQT
jgi:hypothetical protein